MRRVKISRVVANVTSNTYLSVIANNIIGVSLSSANVVEIGNLFYTNARAYANTLSAIKTGNGIVYNSSTGNLTLS